MAQKPTVSIVSISYNHEKFIAKTLDGFLLQERDFAIEIIIADDASTDGTQRIIQEYAYKHPDIFRPILRKKNIGIQPNLNDALRHARGDYIALCEGDDFWTDSTKLKRQVEFLDKRPDYALCFHPVRVFFEGKQEEESIFPTKTTGFTLDNLLAGNYIQTNSVMYRRQQYDKLPNDVLPLDWYLHVYHASFGKIGFINRVMSAYRRHDGGAWWDEYSDSSRLMRRNGFEYLRLFEEIFALFGANEKRGQIIMTEAVEYARAAIINAPDANKMALVERFPRFASRLIEADLDLLHTAKTQLSAAEARTHELEEEVSRLKNSRAYTLASKIQGGKRRLKTAHSYIRSSVGSRGKVTVVVPVYGDWESLHDCVKSLIEFVPTSHKVMFVNDCGPEVDSIEKKLKELIKGHSNFHYYRNPKNLGFVGTCNRAVSLDKTKNNILLLNSDTIVTEGFIDTLSAVLDRSQNIASVSPRSNNATVFSVPFPVDGADYWPPEKSYALYKKFKNEIPEVYEAPTTHGFCMLVRRSVIVEHGLFDPAYGAGYGEENDFCMRTRRAGYTHAIANRAYVFHMGSRSFTDDIRDKKIQENHKILIKRYPEYDTLVKQYIDNVVLPELAILRK